MFKCRNYSLLQTLRSLAYKVKAIELNDFLNGISTDISPKLVIFEGLLDGMHISIEEVIRKRPGMKILVLRDLSQKEVDFTQAKGFKIMDRPFEIDRIISVIRNFSIS